jgi:hypothetical protein
VMLNCLQGSWNLVLTFLPHCLLEIMTSINKDACLKGCCVLKIESLVSLSFFTYLGQKIERSCEFLIIPHKF